MKKSKKKVLGLAVFVAATSAVSVNAENVNLSNDFNGQDGSLKLCDNYKELRQQQLTQEGVNAKVKEILGMSKENRVRLAELARRDFIAFAKENFELTAYHERCLKYQWQDENSEEVKAAIADAIEKADVIKVDVTLVGITDDKHVVNALKPKKRQLEGGYESQDRGWYFSFKLEF